MSTEPTNRVRSATSPAGPGAGGVDGNTARSPYDDARGASGIPYKWLVVSVVIFGIFMSILDSTIVNIALAKLQTVFGVGLNEIQWVFTGYLLALAVSIPLAGYLADRFGIKRVYLTALVLFTIGSALCGLAWSAETIIFFRILQGLGGGALLPLATAMIFSAFPPQERGLASAALGIPILLAPALGPTLGGYIVQYGDWRLIFYLNVPVGIVGLFMGLSLLRERRSPNPGRFDLPGFILSTIGFATLLYGISDASTDGWTSTKVLAFIVVGIVALIGFALVELRSESPLLDLRLFKDWNFTTGNMILWVVTIALFGALFLLPLFLQELRGLAPFETGLWFLPSAVVSAIMLPLSGFLVDRIGAKWVILAGTIILTVASYGLSHLSLYTTFWALQVLLVARSAALAFTLQPANVVALYDVQRNALPRASSLVNVMRQVMSSLGTALLATFVQNRIPVHFAHLAEQATIFSPAAALVNEITQFLVAQGVDAVTAHLQALNYLALLIQRQATVMAFDDAYLLAASIGALGIIVALFLRGRSRVVQRQRQVVGPRPAEGAETREMVLVD
jgi:EmrB/QacA subfamily drug resistance transporter